MGTITPSSSSLSNAPPVPPERSSSQNEPVICIICIEAIEANDDVLSHQANQVHHIFHRECLWDWFRSQPSARCPTCRASLVGLPQPPALPPPPPPPPSRRDRLSAAVEAGDLDEVRSIINEGPIALEGIDFSTILDHAAITAAREGNVEILHYLLEEMDWQFTNFYDFHAALLRALEKRQTETAMILLGMDDVPREVDESGAGHERAITLRIAVMSNCDFSIVRLLIERGYLHDGCSRREFLNIGCAAIDNGNWGVVELLLQKTGYVSESQIARLIAYAREKEAVDIVAKLEQVSQSHTELGVVGALAIIARDLVSNLSS